MINLVPILLKFTHRSYIGTLLLDKNANPVSLQRVCI